MHATVKSAATIAFTLACMFIHNSQASACSPPPPIASRWILPQDTATGVPINAEIRIEYSGSFYEEDPLDDIVVRRKGGDPVEVTVTTHRHRESFQVVAKPKAPLEAMTTYEVLARVIEVPCFNWSPDSPCFVKEPTVVSSFTTGNDGDLVAPKFKGAWTVTQRYETCENDGCCGPYNAMFFLFHFDPATDDGPAEWIRYNVYDTQSNKLVLALVRGVSGYYACSQAGPMEGPFGQFPAAASDYIIRAVDLAGNEEKNEAKVRLDPQCRRPPPCDGGYYPSRDGGPHSHDAGASPPANDNDGCQVAPWRSARGSGGLLIAVFALPLLAWLRTRRRPRPE
ncbi:MAG: Ig-like domain-containing protein [Deltaproteobacteria bacterium]|nr:Ig-like domain-containing protein [Deltaproteobacteria bacterium]